MYYCCLVYWQTAVFAHIHVSIGRIWRHASETHTNRKSREISFVYNIQHSCLIIAILHWTLQFYTEHGNDTVVFSIEFEDDWTTEIDVMDDRIFASSRWIFESYLISQRLITHNVSWFTHKFIGWLNHRNNLVTNSHGSTNIKGKYKHYFLQNSIGQVWAGHTFYWHGLTLILTWRDNYILYKVWDKITYPIPNFNNATVEVYEWISSFISHFPRNVITYPCCD